MKMNLLDPSYRVDPEFYEMFKEDKIRQSSFLSDTDLTIPKSLPSFPIFFAVGDRQERNSQFITAIKVIGQDVITMDRDIFMDERFWHSWLCLYKRDYIISKYPQIMDGYDKFSNIVIKPFNWENYIYKAVLIAQYVHDNVEPSKQENMIQLILNNMDMFNYIIKYEIFRNGPFLIKIMEIIDETGLSSVLKAKIKDRPDLGRDERYGRRVIYEMNKSYPIVLCPMLSKEELKRYFLQYLSYYYHGDSIDFEDDFDDFG